MADIDELRNDIPKPDDKTEESKKGHKAAVIIGVLIGVLVAGGVGGFAAYKYIAPSNARADISSLYSVGEGETALVVDTEIMPEKGVDIGGKTYIPGEFASTYMDDRIYIDSVSKTLTYVTEEEVTDISVGDDVDGMTPLVEQGDALFVALDFIAAKGCCEYTTYAEPNRLAIFHDRGKIYTIITLQEDTKVRTGPGKKYPIEYDAVAGEKLYADTSRQVENEYQPVVTADGISGYILAEDIRMTEQNVREFAATPPSFTQETVGDQLGLGWHNISNEGYTTIPLSTSLAESINVLCPTWIALDGSKGDITTIGNTQYVASAHDAGKKVWSTVSDFKNKGVKLNKVLGRKKYRRKLIKNILNTAKEYSIDGINIDFEKVNEESASAYLEFLRELTVRAHKKGFVVSVDVYPVEDYNMHYNYSELGRVADYVIIMAYDEHYSGSEEAGSVSSLGFVQDAVEQAGLYVQSERLTIALPFYTRLWKETKKKGVVELKSEAMTMGDAENWLWENDIEAQWDDETGQYYAKTKIDKTTYEIWLENAKSLKKKISAVKKAGVSNFAFWAMGQEESMIWDTLNKEILE